MNEPLFDVVMVPQEDGTRRRFSVHEFMELPIHERIRHILTRDIQFLRGGTPVDRSAALRSLRG